MTPRRGDTPSDVAFEVGHALRRFGIRAVLTGGACASLHSRGAYSSLDVDFVLTGETTQERLDAAMASVRFHRRGDRYVRAGSRLFVEFPPGPLGIGGDLTIQPVLVRRKRRSVLSLSATDSCRDRLAAFYHWNDRQSLRAAALVAARGFVDLRVVRAWSRREGFLARYSEFEAEVAALTRRR